MRSESIDALAGALAKAQGVMKNAALNKENPHFRSRYADLASVIDAIREPLSANGLSVVQQTVIVDGALVLRTTLLHSSGQWIESEYPLPMAARPQELGSALTYARRYSLTSLICNAADEDDDANAAEAQKQTAAPPRSRKAAPHEPPRGRPSDTLPQTVAPPVNPETGEISPHPITVSDGEWITFGQQYAAAIRACKTVSEAVDWAEANTSALARMAQEAPKLHKRLSETIAGIVAKLGGGDVLTEDDVKNPENILSGG